MLPAEAAAHIESQILLHKGGSVLPSPKKITILTIGSRGDVQPFIALALGLEKYGHRVRIATHETFKEFVESFGLEHFTLAGDPKELLGFCVAKGVFTFKFLKEAKEKFTGFVRDLFRDCWHACQDEDAIIQAPSVMAGHHVAEKLQVPFFLAFTMPFTRTRTYPNPFAVSDRDLGGTYNYMSHILVEQALWQPVRHLVNEWRVSMLDLPPIRWGSGGHRVLLDRAVPFLYCFSPLIVPKPADWPHWIHITGYWNLDESERGADLYEPDPDLARFLAAGPAPVYIGFGSIVCEDPESLTQLVVGAVLSSGRRAILCKGWGLDGSDSVSIPSELIHVIKSCPHDWLFPRCAAVVHHGGAGTTAAGLLAGRPTVIVSFFGDQFYWGLRVKALGVGGTVRFTALTAEVLSELIETACTDEEMQARAIKVGESLRKEDGVQNAIDAFHHYLGTFKSAGDAADDPVANPSDVVPIRPSTR
eukprot:TRINITY_DN4164_c0_g1_i2.p2 TRINITY_DN4164_c0_g1~~TRINITY_DN4164_c0_g1_i2.p2  ORF type:complete len:475 (-),score=123.42 TRINITY_DN4164_c0_g1_i2:102-1526(-)